MEKINGAQRKSGISFSAGCQIIAIDLSAELSGAICSLHNGFSKIAEALQLGHYKEVAQNDGIDFSNPNLVYSAEKEW